MRNNFDHLLQYFANAVKIAISFKTYLDDKMTMFTMVKIMKQKIPYSGNISMLLLTKQKKTIKNDKIPKNMNVQMPMYCMMKK